jgi:AraC-like DNA-binding protein
MARIPQVRASALQNFRNVARFVGLDPERMFRKARIRPGDKMDPNNRIAASALVDLYEGSASESGREDFGLLMAEARSLAALGPVSLLLQHQPTVRAVVEQVIANMRLLNDIVQAKLEDDGRLAVIRMEVLPGFATPQIVESAVAVACRMYRMLTGGAWQPESVHFRHSAPRSLETHKRIFRCPVVFDNQLDSIVCSSDALDTPNPFADPAMAEHAQRFVDIMAHQRPASSVTEQARNAILLLINGGNATKEKVAENLAIHPRTLQRLLSQEGTSFGELLNHTKRELALRYAASQQSVTSIALMLGYSSTSSFTRWFTDEFGKSPQAWRKARPQDVIVAFNAKVA